MKRTYLWLLTVAILACVTMACGTPANMATPTSAPAVSSPTATAKPAGLTFDALKNAEYKASFLNNKTIRLADGKYQEKAQAGAATETVVALYPKYALGDLNGDGVEDAVVVLASSGGGSGSFYELAVVLNQGGTPRHVASESLGDRIKLEDISIKAGTIAVEMVTHGPQDPLCCPTLKTTRNFKLQGDKLISTDAKP